MPLRSDPGTWDFPLSWFEFAAFEVVRRARGRSLLVACDRFCERLSVSTLGSTDGDEFVASHVRMAHVQYQPIVVHVCKHTDQNLRTLPSSFDLVIIFGCKIGRGLASNGATSN